MKKVILLSAMALLLAAPAMALNIKTSKHNLGDTNTVAAYGKANGTTQICIFCHTPHNASPNIPLWNRSNPAASGFKLYTASPSLNIDGADRGNLSSDSISLFCLSCHDGVAGRMAGRVRNTAGQTLTDETAMRSYAAIGSGGDLTNDHPVNFDYDGVTSGADRGSDADFNDRATIVDVKFFRSSKTGTPSEGYVECASCHDPHGVQGPVAGVRVAKFLRKTNDSSSLCLSCHKK